MGLHLRKSNTAEWKFSLSFTVKQFEAEVVKLKCMDQKCEVTLFKSGFHFNQKSYFYEFFCFEKSGFKGSIFMTKMIDVFDLTSIFVRYKKQCECFKAKVERHKSKLMSVFNSKHRRILESFFVSFVEKKLKRFQVGTNWFVAKFCHWNI